jgi:hypothetical protein
MTNKGTLIYAGLKGYRCTFCLGNWISLMDAEEHNCAKQKQESAKARREEAHRENQGDVMRYMRDILTKRVPRN